MQTEWSLTHLWVLSLFQWEMMLIIMFKSLHQDFHIENLITQTSVLLAEIIHLHNLIFQLN